MLIYINNYSDDIISFNSKKSNIIRVFTLTQTAIIEKQNVYVYNIDVAKSGYKAYGIVGVDTSYPNTLNINEFTLNYDTQKATILIKNPNTTDLSVKCIINVLYITT